MPRSRSPAKSLARLFASASVPIYAVDEKSRLVYCNPACCDKLGLSPDRLVGRTCRYRSAAGGSVEEDIADALCPPPETLAGQSKSGVISCRSAENEPVDWLVDFEPLGTDPLECAGVLVLVRGEGEDAVEARAEPTDFESEADWLHRRLRQLRDRLHPRCRLDYLLGESTAMTRAQAQARLAVASGSSTTVIGPVGSRCELIARAIYYGQRTDRPAGSLVPLSCPLLDAELLQSTIRDVKRRGGEWQPPRPASLLLLDVDELPSQAQAELLGFLRLPGFDLHILSTSRRPLHELRESDAFSADLANLLGSIAIEIPPLARREEDVPLLAQSFLENHNDLRRRPLAGFSSEALDALCSYSWPRDMEELEELVAGIAPGADGPLVQVEDLPPHVRWPGEEEPVREEPPIQLDRFLEEVEAELIRRILRRAKGNRSSAARRLGVSRARLLRRIAHFGIE